MDNKIHELRIQLSQLLKSPSWLSSQCRNAEAAIVADTLCQRLESKPGHFRPSDQPNPLVEELTRVYKSIDDLPDELHGLIHSIEAICDVLPWYKRSAPDSPAFMKGHVNAEIIGPKGLEVREDIIVGITLMRPGITYPDHHHPPAEIYIVLSEGLWRQKDLAWTSPGPGGYVYNPPDIIHAMKSLNTPLFALWCLKP
ncbi:dimethylsulfonioproprionate lyase family protein [Amphritea balenae]|uniref:Transcriptional regulator n=1 Tax=Amphritea balenae TaxID=452629 RepID=A0A3P1SWQ2_9GAMM|nr:dimethylsulfonioproprionate lyase family protein [Amphritea balenae]RRD01560.1 transcriptional regulator [Amphritea balenae]